jgi:hypothetical protein
MHESRDELTVIQFILTLAVRHILKQWQIIVEGAHCNSKPDEAEHMLQPEEAVIENEHDSIHTSIEQGNKTFIMVDGNVKDGLPDTNLNEFMEWTIREISHDFEIQDPGKPSLFSGSFAEYLDTQPGRHIITPMNPMLYISSSTNSNDIMDIQHTSLISHIKDYTPSIQSDIAHNIHKLPNIIYNPNKPHDSSNIYHFTVFANNPISNIVRSASTFTIVTLAIQSWTAAYIHHYIPIHTISILPLQ